MFQDSSLDFKLIQRICLLQQALDQTMDSLEQLRRQVEDHQLLESQLAQTEEYSNVQQKIIAALKHQIAEKTVWQKQVLQSMLAGAQAMIEQQQLELELLRVCILQSQIEVQDYLIRLKNYYQTAPADQLLNQDLELASEVMIVRALTVSLSSQLQSAQQHIHTLDAALTRHQVYFARMQQQSASDAVCLSPSAISPQPSALESDLDPERDPLALVIQIQVLQGKISTITQELQEQFQQQTHLKYRCQQLAAERDYYKHQVQQLKQANTELEEQILQQAHQVTEYEAAIHYWKRQANDA